MMKKAIFVVCFDEICNWVVFLRTTFEIARVYTKKFTLLRIRPTMIIDSIWVTVNSLINIHLIRNPAKGGSPAKFAIIRSRTHFSFLEFGEALIFFCFEFFKNRITRRTEFQ